MRRSVVTRLTVYFVALTITLATCVCCHAQSDVETGLDAFPNLSLGGFGQPTAAPVAFSASVERKDATTAKLAVTAKLQPDWYIYSVTQAAGGPKRTVLKLKNIADVTVKGEFKPNSAPEVTEHKAWPGLKIEEHFEQVTWSVDLTLPASYSGKLEVVVDGQVCDTVQGNCVPVNETVSTQVAPFVSSMAATSPTAPPTQATANQPTETPKPALDSPTPGPIAPYPNAQKPAGLQPAQAPFRDAGYVVEWSGRIEPATAQPGQSAKLILTAKPDAGYHVYAAAVDDTEASTNFVVTEKAGLLIGSPLPSSDPKTVVIHPAVPPLVYHEAAVSWTLPILIPKEAIAGEKAIEGFIGYQACENDRCLAPRALKFSVTLNIGESARDDSLQTLTMVSAPFAATMDKAAETKWVDTFANEAGGTRSAVGVPTNIAPSAPAVNAGANVEPQPKTQSDTTASGIAANRTTPGNANFLIEQPKAAGGLPLPAILAMALCGGLILNLMPCVLPVVGLKVMAFAEQAGESRSRVLALNLWYTFGILVVFWGLAATALAFSFSWGEQYTFFHFRYAIILLVFAMALSFLGVWEIPIPGFVGGRSTQELQRREGAAGAFFKGVFTTVLATPCSGPLLGPVFGFLLGQTAIVTVLVFTCIGLGMAMPYLLVALYPSLLVYFPKPGVWMDTFKQLLGFLLLGTVVYLFGIFADEDRMPVFASLIGVWFGCWLIGLVPHWAELERRVFAWSGGICTAALICFLAFHFLSPGPPVLNWEPYDEVRLRQLQAQGRTVLIDFTAKWCPNCIVNYEVAINTPETSKLVSELNAIPMLADWTDNNDAIKNKLIELQSNSIPLLAIYPGRNPESPIILRDLVSQNDVLEALRKAGSSQSDNDVRQVSTRNASSYAPAH